MESLEPRLPAIGWLELSSLELLLLAAGALEP